MPYKACTDHAIWTAMQHAKFGYYYMCFMWQLDSHLYCVITLSVLFIEWLHAYQVKLSTSHTIVLTYNCHCEEEAQNSSCCSHLWNTYDDVLRSIPRL